MKVDAGKKLASALDQEPARDSYNDAADAYRKAQEPSHVEPDQPKVPKKGVAPKAAL
jgi:hypothetical protein